MLLPPISKSAALFVGDFTTAESYCGLKEKDLGLMDWMKTDNGEADRTTYGR